jgi:hypothetical protein
MRILRGTLPNLLVLAASLTAASASDTNVIAISGWSEPVPQARADMVDCGSVRGRLLILYADSANHASRHPETQVYLELQNVGKAVHHPLDIYFDPRGSLQREMRDAHDRIVTRGGGPGSGIFPAPCWVTLPCDASIRLRASWYGYGMPRNQGLMIPLFQNVFIRPGDTNEYSLTVTFTATLPPTNHVSSPENCVWQGKLTLPPLKLSAGGSTTQ